MCGSGELCDHVGDGCALPDVIPRLPGTMNSRVATVAPTHVRLHPRQLAQPPGLEEQQNLANLARISAKEPRAKQAPKVNCSLRAEEVSKLYENVPLPTSPVRNLCVYPCTNNAASPRIQIPQDTCLDSKISDPGANESDNDTTHGRGFVSPVRTTFMDTTITDVAAYQNVPLPGMISKARNVVPPDVICQYSKVGGDDGFEAGEILEKSMARLRETGFYYGKLTSQEAKEKLHKAQVGTFLVRDSSDPMAQASLSVKTHRGTTSIRVIFVKGYFRLDCDPLSVHKMPTFGCILKLIEYYVNQSASDARNRCVFLEESGRRDTPVILIRPHRETIGSLQHLCRRSIHRQFAGDDLERLMNLPTMPCSVKLRNYLQEYPCCL